MSPKTPPSTASHWPAEVVECLSEASVAVAVKPELARQPRPLRQSCHALPRRRSARDQAASLTMAAGGCQRIRFVPDRSGGIVATVPNLNVRDLNVVFAIWTARLGRHVAETDLRRTRLAQWPAAGDDAAVRAGC